MQLNVLRTLVLKLLFNESQLEKLRRMLAENPDAIAVVLTDAERANIYEALLTNNDSNCIFMYEAQSFFYFNGRKIGIVKA